MWLRCNVSIISCHFQYVVSKYLRLCSFVSSQSTLVTDRQTDRQNYDPQGRKNVWFKLSLSAIWRVMASTYWPKCFLSTVVQTVDTKCFSLQSPCAHYFSDRARLSVYSAMHWNNYVLNKYHLEEYSFHNSTGATYFSGECVRILII